MVDNYDSFTYNLVHLFAELGADVIVRRNDAVTPDEAEALAPSHLVISPGPGRPEDAGASLADSRAPQRQRSDPGRLPRPPGFGATARRDRRAGA